MPAIWILSLQNDVFSFREKIESQNVLGDENLTEKGQLKRF